MGSVILDSLFSIHYLKISFFLAKVNFTYALKRFFPDIDTQDIAGATICEILDSLEQRFPGMRSYILDDQGRLREHVNIFLNGELIKDKFTQTDIVKNEDEIFIMQALSGGLQIPDGRQVYLPGGRQVLIHDS